MARRLIANKMTRAKRAVAKVNAVAVGVDEVFRKLLIGHALVVSDQAVSAEPTQSGP